MSEGPALSKGPDAFRTISEVAEELDLPQHVLRFWETRFSQIRPMKRGGGRRYYRPDDVELLRGIRRLLYGEGYTIKGVQRILKEQGPRSVVAAGQGEFGAAPITSSRGEDFMDEVPEGILVDRRPAAPQVRAARRVEERREPIFGPPKQHAPAAMSVRSPGERPAEPAGRAPPTSFQPPPVVSPAAPTSRIPAAPPDEPGSSDAYLPPAAAPNPPPERSWSPAQPFAENRRGTYAPVARSYAPPSKDDERPPPTAAAGPASRGPAPDEPELSADDVRLLQATLVELLECKRILDQSR